VGRLADLLRPDGGGQPRGRTAHGRTTPPAGPKPGGETMWEPCLQ
jgi:hypothetical protein